MPTEAFLPLFGISPGPEVLVILLIAILLFGANKIPKLARSSGEAIGEFQKGKEEVEQELEQIRESGTEVTETTTEPREVTEDVPEPEEADEETSVNAG